MSREVKALHHVSSAYDVGEAHRANEASLRLCRRRLVGEERASTFATKRGIHRLCTNILIVSHKYGHQRVPGSYKATMLWCTATWLMSRCGCGEEIYRNPKAVKEFILLPYASIIHSSVLLRLHI